ncbi:hypothetical protein STEG23_014256 [Scotinomys teguina]
MTVTPLGRDQDCSLKNREPDVPAPWFLDPGGWSKTATVRLYFIFPGICTLSLAANRSPGPSREGAHTAPLTSATIRDSEGLEPTGAPTEGLPSRLHTEFTMKEILPHGTLGLKSYLLMSVFLMFGSLGVTSESPHQIKKLTWQVISQTGDVVWAITANHMPFSWWPNLTPNFCQLAAGLESWDIEAIDLDKLNYTYTGSGTGAKDISHADQRTWANPFGTFHNNNPAVMTAPGCVSPTARSWGCETTGAASWNPTSSWDLIIVSRGYQRPNSESANQDLQNRLLNLESANLMQELQSINNKCIAKIGFVDNKYEYLMDRTLTLQSDVVTTQTQCKEERLSLIDKLRSLESCVSEEHNRWYDSMKNLESLAREEVHSLEQTLYARLQALEETLCKHDKEPNKQKGKTIKVITFPNGYNPMAYPVIIHESPADDTHPEPYVAHSLQPISIRDFKNMKEAIVTYGIHSTYVKQMLNSWSTSNRIIPDDWHQLTSAVLEYIQQLQWKSWFREEARNLEQQGSISNLLGIMGIPKDGLQNFANTLEGDKDLNSPRELSPEAEKELAIVEKTIREAHVDRVNPELKCILVILPSRHSPTGILMQREDVILEWIFLPRKPNKKLKTYIEKISDLILKGNHQK